MVSCHEFALETGCRGKRRAGRAYRSFALEGNVFVVISVFLTLYGGMHFYIFRKTVAAFSMSPGPLLVALTFLLLAPLVAEVLKGVRLFVVAEPLGRVGYAWMGFAFLFFFSLLSLDVVVFLFKAVWRLFSGPTGPIPALSPVPSFLVALGLALAATAHGFIAARQVNVEQVRIESAELQPGSAPLRIVQISDLHLDLWSDEGRIERIAEVIESLRPDLLVSTGDLFDLHPDRLDGLLDRFRRLAPRFGKFAVTGNHEGYMGPARTRAAVERAGFRLLAQDGVTVNGNLHIVGVDDPAVQNRIRTDGRAERELLKRFPQEGFTVLLKHQPRVDRESASFFDLQLSGHTHGGQIFPFHLISRLAYPAAKPGLSRLEKEALLYVSRGTGTWGPPIRFLAPPEITVIDLVPAPAAGKAAEDGGR